MKTKKEYIGYMAWFVVSVFYSYQYILRVMPGIMVNDLINQFDINATAFGQFAGLYYIGYGLLHLPLGILIDRHGAKIVVPLCILFTVLGQLPLIYTENWTWPVIGKILTGAASSGAILGVFKVIRMFFEEKKFTRMLTISVTIGLIGAIYGGGPLTYIYNIIGYRNLLKLISIGGIVLAIIVYFLIPKASKKDTESILSNIKHVFTNKKVVIGSILSGLLVGPLEGFADVWAPEFLKIVYQFDSIKSASIPSMIFIGFCFGGPILSLIAEKSNNYLGTVIGAGIFMGTAFIGLVLNMYTQNVMIVIFLIVGMACAYQIIIIYKISTYVPENIVSLTTAFTNMVIMCFGYIYHTTIGVIINNTGGLSSSFAFKCGISSVPVLVFLGVFGFIYMANREK